MRKYTQRELKYYVSMGLAVDITTAATPDAIPERFEKVGYCHGVNGCNGLLLRGTETGTLYAITRRTTAVFIFG